VARLTPAASRQPGPDCPLCPRLEAFRAEWPRPRARLVQCSGRILRVDRGAAPHRRLAPGLRGANRTGRPFTGDFAGDLLYATLARFGFARGRYDARPDDGLTLIDARITNAVRCVPPENKPTPAEIKTCRPFLETTIAEMQNLRAIVTLGRISHDSTIARSTTAVRPRRSAMGGSRRRKTARVRELPLLALQHQYRVLTPKMFEDVFAAVRADLDAAQDG